MLTVPGLSLSRSFEVMARSRQVEKLLFISIIYTAVLASWMSGRSWRRLVRSLTSPPHQAPQAPRPFPSGAGGGSSGCISHTFEFPILLSFLCRVRPWRDCPKRLIATGEPPWTVRHSTRTMRSGIDFDHPFRDGMCSGRPLCSPSCHHHRGCCHRFGAMLVCSPSDRGALEGTGGDWGLARDLLHEFRQRHSL